MSIEVACLTPTSHEFVALDSVDELATFDASPILCQQTYFGGGFNRLPESQMEQGKYIFENPYGNILQYTPDQLWAVFDPSHSNALISVGFGGFDIPEGDLYPTDKQCWDQIVEDDTVYANTFMCHIRIVCSTTMVPSLVIYKFNAYVLSFYVNLQ